MSLSAMFSKKMVPAQPWAIFLCGLSCFIPLMTGNLRDYTNSPVMGAVTTQSNRELAVAASALTFPIFLEILTDATISLRSEKHEKVKSHVQDELLNPQERSLLALGVLASSAPALMTPGLLYLVNIYYSFYRCRLIFTGGALMISLNRYDVYFWPTRTVNFIIFCLCAGSILASFADNAPSDEMSFIVHQVGLVLFLLSFVIFALCSIRWTYHNFPIICTAIKSTSGTQIDSKYYKLFPLMHIATLTVTSAVLIIEKRLRASDTKSISNSLFFHNLIYVLYFVFIMYISVRKMKSEVLHGLYSLIESKKMYVRYISHELRTPLNSAFLGLKLVSDDLMASNSDKDSDHCETLMDVQSACRTAVEILNDLLCFDKLESGILKMHKHEVPVIPFIADCVNMFASQAREAGVTIKNTTSQGRQPPGIDANMSDSSSISALPSVMMDIIDGDIAFMDKFKMDQVLRNLISNAVKFTPSGGSVTVCASFIPGNTEDDVDESRTRRSSDVNGGKGTLPCTGWWVPLSVLWSRFVTLLNCCVRKRRVHVSVRLAPDDIESGPTHLLHEYPHCLGDKMSSRLPGHDNDIRIDREWDHSSSAVGGLSNNNNGNNPCHGRNLTNDNTPSEAGDGLHSLNDHTPNIAGKLRIVVTDTGAGISVANQQRLFKEIVQFNPEVLQAGGGSGLGLWISNSIVQMHAGTIKAYSGGPNKGSTFTVEIDMIRRVLPNQPTQVDIQENCIPDTGSVESCGAEEAMGYSKALEYLERGNEDYPLVREIVTQSSRSSRFQPILQSSSFRIAAGDAKDHHQHDNFNLLVVDDSGLNRKLLCKLLRASGHTCEEAADGFCAVEKVKARMASASGGASTYDAILMDFVMPNMDGPTATETIRGLGYSGPIFGVTGNALGSDVNYFISHGADAVLAKPFDYQLFKILMEERKKPTLI